MERRSLAIPEIALISGTRAALGAGIGLLLADRLSDEQRHAVGWTLLAVGAITTLPIAIQLFSSGGSERSFSSERSGGERWARAVD